MFGFNPLAVKLISWDLIYGTTEISTMRSPSDSVCRSALTVVLIPSLTCLLVVVTLVRLNVLVVT